MASIIPSGRIIYATLTRRGRELLFSNNERFFVSSFGLGDDEINYNLLNQNDPDFGDIESLVVYEPNSQKNSLGHGLIRFADNLEQVIAQKQNSLIPNNEVRIVTKLDGPQTLSLENWNTDAIQVSFAIYEPDTQKYFLSNAFSVDFSEFWIKYGIYFNVVPINPIGALGGTMNYWFVPSDATDTQGNIIPIKIGIDNDHKPLNGVSVSNILNTLDIPILTFEISLRSEFIKKIYNYMVQNTLSSITSNITITNQDATVSPITAFFGPNANYLNISTTLPITITF